SKAASAAFTSPIGRSRRAKRSGGLRNSSVLNPLTPALSPVEVGCFRLRPNKMPNSGKPEFGWEREPALPRVMLLRVRQCERRSLRADEPRCRQEDHCAAGEAVGAQRWLFREAHRD